MSHDGRLIEALQCRCAWATAADSLLPAGQWAVWGLPPHEPGRPADAA